MNSIFINRAAGEPAQIAFDKAARIVRALFAEGYSCKKPARGFQPGEFALETLPNAAGWKITIAPIPGKESPVSLAA